MKFTIRHKLLFGFAVVLAALVGVGAMNLLRSTSSNKPSA